MQHEHVSIEDSPKLDDAVDEKIYEKKIYNVKSYKTYYARHYFPLPKNLTSYQNILYTPTGISYMTSRIDAELTAGIIISHCNEKNIKYNDIIITDATTGLGGNTLSFAKLFKHVYAIEKDYNTYKILENNMKEYGYSNVTLINDDFMNIYESFNQHVIFIDPPWGGKNYMKHKNLRLKLSDVEIEYICSLLRKNIIVLKLPINYDFQYLLTSLSESHVTPIKITDIESQNFLMSLNETFIETTTSSNQHEIVRYEYDIANIHIHRLKKMYIVVIMPI
jgi:predicted RNA methylase